LTNGHVKHEAKVEDNHDLEYNEYIDANITFRTHLRWCGGAQLVKSNNGMGIDPYYDAQKLTAVLPKYSIGRMKVVTTI
jgi:hypothetical protein